MYGYTNEAGEPIMDGAAYRFEQQLDMDDAMNRYEDDFYDYEPDEDEDDEDTEDDGEGFLTEDQWLDGSYEE